MVFVDPSKYPKSDSFIIGMVTESVERTRKLGWRLENTLFFEIPYCAISGVCSGIARDYENRVYYKFFCATEGVIPSLTDLQLRVVTEHEQDEIDQCTHAAIEDSAKTPFTSLEEEIERHKIEMQPIESRYGKDVVQSALRRVMEISSTKTLIPRYVLSFWMCSYFLARFEQYKLWSTQMAPTMLSEKQKSFFIQTLDKVHKEYGSNAPVKEYMQLYLSAIRNR